MIPRICPVCGKPQSTSATVCPRCNHTLPDSPKAAPINPQWEHVKLYELMIPAVEDPEKLSSVERKMEQHFEKYRSLLSHNAYSALHSIVYDAFREANDYWKATKEVNRRAAQAALTSINVAMNQQSTYEGLGFSVISDGVGIATYAALDAIQGHIHDVNQTAAAYKAALNKLSAISVSSDNASVVRPVFQAIDRVVEYLPIMVAGKQFVDAHRGIYDTLLSDTKAGGKYVSITLRTAAYRSEFLGTLHFTEDQPSYQTMEAAGYIHLFYTKQGIAKYYCTTGKLEAEVLQSQFFKENPQIAAAEKKAVAEADKAHCIQAEISLKEGKFFRAATRFAQTADDRNALRRSIKIWNQHLMQLPEMTCGYMLGADGNAQSIFTSLSMHIPFNEKLYAEGVKYRDIHPCGDRQYVGLSVDGRVYSSSENIFGDLKPSRSELGTAYLPGNGSEWTNITAIACSGNHLVGLRTDGTVCAVGSNTSGQCNLSGWADIIAIEAVKNSTAAIKKDGTVLLAGAIAEYASEVSKWSKIARLYLRENGLIGLRADGQVLAAGKTGFDNQVISRWRNVVRIHWFSDGVFAISDAGDVFCVSSDPLTEILCRNLTGIVSIIHFRSHRGSAFEHRPSLIALRANGTVYTTGVTANVSDWSEIVYVYCEERNTPNLVALNAKGEFLFYGPLFANMEPKENPFSHIDTYAEQQRNMLEEVLEHKKMLLSKAKGLFAGKRRKELQGSIDFLQNKLARMDT